MESEFWTREAVIASVLRLDSNGIYLGGGSAREEFPALYDAARRLFGSWRKAIEKAGIPYDRKATKQWTRGRIISEIEKLNKNGGDISSGAVSRYAGGLYGAARKEFGSWRKALEIAGISWDDMSECQQWDKEKVESAIRSLDRFGEPLNYKFMYYRNPRLLKASEKHFGSWKAALEFCGFDYDDIRKDRGKTEFTGKDGLKYDSSLEMLIADELFDLKSSKKIIGYSSHVRLTHNRRWSCDFLVYLNNNTDMWLEVDAMGGARNPPYGDDHPKIRFFRDSGLIIEVVTSTGCIPDLISKRTDLYSIPEEPSIITSHANPDADAISSCVAVHSYLAERGIKSWIRLEGDIPENLMEMIPEDSLVHKIPENAKRIVVLDSGCEEERLGWTIPELPILNIDHHISRIQCHDPENGIFVMDMCSTAAVLVRHFGIKESILLAGIYGDTLFRRRIGEISQLLVTMDVDEDTSRTIIDLVDQINSGMVLTALQKAAVKKHRNGFMLVELRDHVPSWAITDIMSIVSRMGESICLISETGEVRLRTSNSKMDVASIAEKFGGGGHMFAAGCFVNGKRSKLKKEIRSFSVLNK